MTTEPRTLEALYQETRAFRPPSSLAATAEVRDREAFDRAARNIEGS